MAASLAGVRMIADKGKANAPATVAEIRPAARTGSNSRTAVVTAVNGHFQADARIDNRPITFIVDTGASAIAIRESDAARLGYRPGVRDFTTRISTANGEGRAAQIELRRVEVGDIVLRDVRAFVVPDKALDVNLLGMSFLSRVDWKQADGKLVLEQ